MMYFNLRVLASWRAILAVLLLIAGGAVAVEKDLSSQLPRVPATEPNDALKTFQLLDGFSLQMVAGEPLVASPVAGCYDEKGRLYLVEMRDYSEQEHDMLGRIRLLEDADQDGVMDKATIFAEGLSWPTAICCWEGGVFVGASPDIYYLKDADGDGKAEIRKTVYTGFERTNVQGLLNSFLWGLDNRFHCATSSSGGVVKRADGRGEALNLRGRDFAFDPRSLVMQPISGGAQHGASFDDWGRRYVGSNSDHIQMVMYEDRYLKRNPRLAAPGPRLSIAADGPQAEVYRISPVEAWRVLRTRMRLSGESVGAVEGGGRAAGYFTGSTGVTIYRGDAWPQNLQGIALANDVGSNLCHRKILKEAGVGFTAYRMDAGKEFIASTDIWFRPVQYIMTPDGTLDIIDMYRQTIEHPKSLPPEIKKHLDLTSGRDRGRIYRIAPPGYTYRKTPDLSKATAAQLAALLGHPNAWHRETAARLLYERQDTSALQPLRKLAAGGDQPLGRMHAMYALAGLGALTAEEVSRGLSDAHPRVREHAVKLAEEFGDEEAIRSKLYAMVDDADTRVRYQLAFTLGELKDSGRSAALAAILKKDGGDSWIRMAALSSSSDGAGPLLARMARDDSVLGSAGGQALLEELARQVVHGGKPADLAAVVKIWKPLVGKNDAAAAALLRGMSSFSAKKGLREAIAAAADESAGKLFDQHLASLKNTALNKSAAPENRAAAARMLKLLPAAEARLQLLALLEPAEPQQVQYAALATLGSMSDPKIGPDLLERWNGLGPAMRSEVMETLLARGDRVLALLDAIEKGKFPVSDLNAQRIGQLKGNSKLEIRKRADLVLASVKIATRRQVVEEYRAKISGLQGDPAKGKAMFGAVCAACHKLENVGNEIGPNLVQFTQQKGSEGLLLNLIDPNAEVNPLFVLYLVTTTDGRTLSGMITSETASNVTLNRGAGAVDTVLRSEIKSMQSTGRSLMPEGLEAALGPQGVADMIAYLLSVK